jgi:AbrB family looped-hinge helix DNA binding protein
LYYLENLVATVKVLAKGQIVIPAKIRKKIGLKPGTKVLLTLVDQHKVSIEPIPDDPIEAACGMLQGTPSLTHALLKERREDRAQEKKKFARFIRATRFPKQRKRVRQG